MKKLMIVILVAVMSVMIFPLVGLAEDVPPTGFDKYIVYMAAGRYDDDVEPAEGNLADWFHKEIMGRNDAEISEAQAEADTYFEKQFGPDLPKAMAFGFDPRNEYRAYVSSGEEVPSAGWVVRDGGFMVMFSEETTLYGEYGGEEGKTIPAGSMLVYGDYNIDRTPSGKEPLIIHYRSASPVVMNPYEPGFRFDCIVSSEEFGTGRAQGLSNPQMVDGQFQANIRTQITFPAYGPSVQH